MKRQKFTYVVENRLAELLQNQRIELSLQRDRDVLVREVEEELAEYCELKRKSIIDIKRGVNHPSLPVAMRIASYFNVLVEDIFQLKTKEQLRMQKAEKIKSLLKELDNDILGELNETLESYLEEVKQHHPDVTVEENSAYGALNSFYLNLLCSGGIVDTCMLIDSLEDAIEADKEENA